MNEKTYPTLVTAAENMTWDELCLAPELSTLAALDASLLATTTTLKACNPVPRGDNSQRYRFPVRVDEHLAESICILAQALRRNLAAYYASIQECCDDDSSSPDIEF